MSRLTYRIKRGGRGPRGTFTSKHTVQTVNNRLGELEEIIYGPDGAERITPERLKALVEADTDKRCLVLPPTENSECEGLYGKYRVFKARNNEPVEDCFVLRPDKDAAARYALLTYATYCGNPQLAGDLNRWIDEIYRALPGESDKGTAHEH
jgi:hypothetical protein